MTFNKMGNSDLEISRLSLGCVTFGREIDRKESYTIMDHALSRGMNFFDTAEVYGEGASEQVVGSWLKERKKRSKVYLGTKLLPPYNPERIIKSCDESLRRLQATEIDLYQLHSFHETALHPDVLHTFENLINDGKIRYLGVSNFSSEQLQEFLGVRKKHKLSSICSIQNNHNLAIRNLNKNLLKFCRQEGIGSISFSPLGAGFLTGKYKNRIPEGARFDIQPGHQDIYFNNSGMRTLEELESAAAETGKSMVELALAWVLKNPDLTTTLVGGRNISQIDQAFNAMENKILDIASLFNI